MGVLAQHLDLGAAAPAIVARQFVLIAVGLGSLADPEVEARDLAVAQDAGLILGKRLSGDGGVGQQQALGGGLGHQHDPRFLRDLHGGTCLSGRIRVWRLGLSFPNRR